MTGESTAPVRVLSETNATYAYLGAFVDELRRAGVRHVVICPGSRSTPLAITFAEQSERFGAHGIRVWMQVDERSAAFFALGLAKATRAPVALVCTSGTAAANFFPAVVEARLAHVPLLLLTADRPPELRETGAPQAIDQNRLYGAHAKWFVEVALPEATDEALRYIRTLADRATALAAATPAGPVHLNIPLREPLTPEPGPLPAPAARDAAAWGGRPAGAPYTVVEDAPLAAPVAPALRALAAALRLAPHGLLLAGPLDAPELAPPLLALARRLGYPLLADPLSQLRDGLDAADVLVTSYDAFLRVEAVAQTLAPTLTLRFGAAPTSKPLNQFLARQTDCRQLVVDGEAGWPEPSHQVAELIHADPVAFCHALLAALDELEGAEAAGGALDRSWVATWRRADDATRATLDAALRDETRLFEGRVFVELAEALPGGATLVVGNSMPVRDLDTFYQGSAREARILGNRGANGIDGVVSTALGASAAQRAAGSRAPVVLVIGDLSFYHDLNGLLAAKLHGLDLTVVLLNNDGGGIFSFLPQAEHPQYFERLFGTPTGLDFSHAVELYGGRFQRVASWGAFRDALDDGLRAGGLRVVEVVAPDRAQNVAIHRALWRRVAAALGEARVIPDAPADSGERARDA